jgi:tetratricopeptide (TPR) repeat protein
MKNQILVTGVLLISAITFGQKKELKKAEKALESKEITEAMGYINEAEPLIGTVDNDMKAQFYALKGEAYLAQSNKTDIPKIKTAADAFLMAVELDPNGKYGAMAQNGLINVRAHLVNSAVADQNAKKYASASDKLYASYTFKKDTSDLYYAAGNAVNAQDYDKALSYYEQLLDMGYTGIQKEFIATDVETGEIVVFSTEEVRNSNLLAGAYTNPDERTSPSVRGDILRNVTLIYTSKGQNDKALKVMKDARAENPDDMSLLRAEADMVYKMGNIERYNELMQELIESDPNNPEIYFNLGVASASKGDKVKATEYYNKAIELKPDYGAALINIASIMLEDEAKIVEEMNGLGTSNADNKRYDLLKQKRKDLYLNVLPYLEN